MRLISAHATQGAATRIPLPNTITWTLFGGKTDKPLNDQSDQQSASNNVPLAASRQTGITPLETRREPNPAAALICHPLS